MQHGLRKGRSAPEVIEAVSIHHFATAAAEYPIPIQAVGTGSRDQQTLCFNSVERHHECALYLRPLLRCVHNRVAGLRINVEHIVPMNELILNIGMRDLEQLKFKLLSCEVGQDLWVRHELVDPDARKLPCASVSGDSDGLKPLIAATYCEFARLPTPGRSQFWEFGAVVLGNSSPSACSEAVRPCIEWWAV